MSREINAKFQLTPMVLSSIQICLLERRGDVSQFDRAHLWNEQATGKCPVDFTGKNLPNPMFVTTGRA